MVLVILMFFMLFKDIIISVIMLTFVANGLPHIYFFIMDYHNYALGGISGVIVLNYV